MESGDIIEAHLEQVRTRLTAQGYPCSKGSQTAWRMALTAEFHSMRSLPSHPSFTCTICCDNEIISRIGTMQRNRGCGNHRKLCQTRKTSLNPSQKTPWKAYNDHPTASEISLTLVTSASLSAYVKHSLSISFLPCVFAALAK